MEMPTIQSQLPLKYDGKKSCWEEFNGYCSECDEQIDPADVRGSVAPFNSEMYVVDAVGICRECALLSTYQYRLFSDMRIVGRNKEGKWCTWQMRRTLLQKIVSYVHRKLKEARSV